MFSVIYRCSEYLRLIRDVDLPSLWRSLSTGRTIPCLPETFALKSVGGEVRFINIVKSNSCFHFSISILLGVDIFTYMDADESSFRRGSILFRSVARSKIGWGGEVIGKLHYF